MERRKRILLKIGLFNHWGCK